MRTVLSLSLDNKIITKIKKQSSRFGFNSVSEYIRRLIESYDDIISEDELLAYAKQAEKEYRQGKTTKANSLADLL